MSQGEFQVLVVDDEKNICDLLKQTMETTGCVVHTVCDAEEAIELAQGTRFDAIFLDIKMPGMNGVELLKNLNITQPDAAFVMITGYATSDLVDESLSSGAFICLSKPFSLAQVLDVVKTLREEKDVTTPVQQG
ncbi:MAG: response regulator [Armatimonadetes bacterium]|nr:response regulator [Armatimonadota bacterium]NIM23115.1 response regulator [Armatimonadota bacterium]NIM66983.1 response regulator [Armatimonadota bacterium]NIM75517.1 response regulator [Armatimonadota bacterium]NIN05172.1 response regulator [Armatimonadota bacterium]